MGDQIRDIMPRERRYSVLSACAANVSIKGGADNDSSAVAAKLVDLSRTGAELSVASCPSIDDAARLLISIAELRIDLAVAIEVCWAQPGDDDSWRLGCRFEPELSGEIVEQLAAGGFLDRRASPRTPVSLRATACWEHEEARIPVRLHDISEGGFCMSCAQIGQSERRLLLNLSRADGKMESIHARMQWRLKKDDQFLVGCALENVLDYHRLRAVAEADAAQRELAARRPPRTPWIMFGSVASITFVVSFVLLSLATRPPSQTASPLVADARSSRAGNTSADRSPNATPTAASPPAATPVGALPDAPPAPATNSAPASTPPLADADLPGGGEVVISEEIDAVARMASKPAALIPTADVAPTADALPQPRSSDNEHPGPAAAVVQPSETHGAPLEPGPRPESATDSATTPARPGSRDEPGGETGRVPPTAADGRAPVVNAGQAPVADGQPTADMPPRENPYGIRESLRKASEARRAALQRGGVPTPDDVAAPWSKPAPERDHFAVETPRQTPADSPLALPIDPAFTPPTREGTATPLGEPTSPPTVVLPTDEPTPLPPVAAPPVDVPTDEPSSLPTTAPPAVVLPSVVLPAVEAAPPRVVAPPRPIIRPADETTAGQTESREPGQAEPSAPLAIDRPPPAGPEGTGAEIAPDADNLLAIAAFNRGHELYRRRQYAPAAEAFLEAIGGDAANPLYYYTLALAQYQMGQRDAALRSARQAVQLERARPIGSSWGGQMQSYQGGPRLWLERLRNAG
jgi:PilZ domain